MYELLHEFLLRFVPSLTEHEFEYLKTLLDIIRLEKKQILVKEGEVANHLYFVTEGLIHQYFYANKEMVTVDLIGPGTITGATTSFLLGAPSHYCLATLEPTTVLAITKEKLENLYSSDRKWQKFGRLLITHFLLQQEQAILDRARFSVRERFIMFAEKYPCLMEKVPQRRLASYLSIEPETFTRLKPLLDQKKNKR
jgi:CRP-like cAMP-binding protein